MIIKLKGADFSLNNINSLLNSWLISISGRNYVTVSSNISSVDKNGSYLNTFTVKENYEVSNVVVTMGGVTQSGVVDVTSGAAGTKITINIGQVTGAVNIVFTGSYVGTGDEPEPEDPVIPDEPSTTYTFPLRAVGVGVTSNGTGRMTSASARLANASTTEPLGILVPAGKTITLNGLTSGTYPLRFDYVYGTVNALNPVSSSSTPIEGLVGTASNYIADVYFPLNIEGADSYSIANISDTDYYYWFVFAGLTKEEQITAAIDTYNITYTIAPNTAEVLTLPVTPLALGVTTTGTGRATDNNTRLSTANTSTPSGIMIPAGKTMYLTGLASGTYPLRFDYIYGAKNVVNPDSTSTIAIEGLVGTASNYVANDYFPINKSGADSCSITNTYGEDYYFWLGFAGLNKSEAIKAEINTYDIKYCIM